MIKYLVTAGLLGLSLSSFGQVKPAEQKTKIAVSKQDGTAVKVIQTSKAVVSAPIAKGLFKTAMAWQSANPEGIQKVLNATVVLEKSAPSKLAKGMAYIAKAKPTRAALVLGSVAAGVYAGYEAYKVIFKSDSTSK